MTNSEGRWFNCDPKFATNATERSCRGVVTLLHPHAPFTDLEIVDTTMLQEAWRLQHRYLLVRGMHGTTPVYLHNIYAPQNYVSRAAFFDSLPRSFETTAIHIAGGDFNVVLHDFLDTVRVTSYVQTGRESLPSWLATLNLADAFRVCHPARRELTGPGSVNRLDYIFVSTLVCDGLLSRCSHIQGTTMSDHAACTMHLTPTLCPGKGPWRTPSWLLNTTAAKMIVVDLLQAFCESTTLGPDVGFKYDDMLFIMRKSLKALHEAKLQAQDAKLNELKLALATTLLDWADCPCDATAALVATRKRDVQDEMARTAEFKAEAHMQRTIQQAERCSKLHLRPPKPKPLLKQSIRAMQDVDGVTHRTRAGIESSLQDFYAKLYMGDTPAAPEAVNQYLREANTPTLLPDAAKRLAAPLLASEFYSAIKAASCEKAPGPNALPHEVLKLAPSEWAVVLELVFASQLHEHATLTSSQ
ncbi:hypothetical protein ACHHYP_09148 [Achlya hypogyna]|uniref:Endonuclease/exonuclease/phosphatase domain-containing protein n=1 Tax=Achlya hypogyna TaxID=1202772 RepID=A0A1V9ZJG1_ACHHY|nr:hypothetical protein ACHHYP_09148 [Achlya hypogyna]